MEYSHNCVTMYKQRHDSGGFLIHELVFITLDSIFCSTTRMLSFCWTRKGFKRCSSIKWSSAASIKIN